jgi:hypothetical protein
VSSAILLPCLLFAVRPSLKLSRNVLSVSRLLQKRRGLRRCSWCQAWYVPCRGMIAAADVKPWLRLSGYAGLPKDWMSALPHKKWFVVASFLSCLPQPACVLRLDKKIVAFLKAAKVIS